MNRLCKQEINIETWVEPTFEVPHMVTGPFTVGREGAHCSATSTVCTPSTESLERTLCQLLAAYSCLEVSATRSYEKPDNVKASMHVAMADLLAIKQLPVLAFSIKAATVCFLVQSQIVNESLVIHYFAVIPP